MIPNATLELIDEIFTLSTKVLELDRLTVNNIIYNDNKDIFSDKAFREQRIIFSLMRGAINKTITLVDDIEFIMGNFIQIWSDPQKLDVVTNVWHSCIDTNISVVETYNMRNSLFLTLVDGNMFTNRMDINNNYHAASHFRMIHDYRTEYLTKSMELHDSLMPFEIIQYKLKHLI